MINFDAQIQLIALSFRAEREYVQRKLIWKIYELGSPELAHLVPGVQDAARLRELAKPMPSADRHGVDIACHLVILTFLDTQREAKAAAAVAVEAAEQERLQIANPIVDALDI